MEMKTIAVDSRPAVAELKEFCRGYNDELRGESAATDTGKEYWTGSDGTADSFAAGRAGVRLLANPDLVEIRRGDGGDRPSNGREAAVNQGWTAVIPAYGLGTNSRRRNAEYR